ncbi:MAG: mismatch-specific DNA-glycosylase, partial [Dehalococcoidia bacterium]|nr:mismatch-specific DNA-glycosylase [Dehalococcoidia bacterium]
MGDDSSMIAYSTLPDYLETGLKLVFVGINPGLYSVARGHYFARPTNRFWPAFSRSRLSEPIRTALGRQILRPEDDSLLPGFGIGFTDTVKRPTRNAAALAPADFQEWTPILLDHLRTFRPGVACFHGLTAYRHFARYALSLEETEFALGPQAQRIKSTRLFVVPNPSPANAHFRHDEIAA